MNPTPFRSPLTCRVLSELRLNGQMRPGVGWSAVTNGRALIVVLYIHCLKDYPYSKIN